MFLLSLSATCQVWTVSLKAGQSTYKGLECLSMPDFFHCMHDLVKSYSLPLGQRLRQAHQELIKAKEAMTRRQGAPLGDQPDPKAKALGAITPSSVVKGVAALMACRRCATTSAERT